MGRRAQEDFATLIVKSQAALGMLGVDLAQFLGVSSKTITRWGGRRTSGHLPYRTLHKLVNALHPKDPALAQRVAAHHGHLAESLLRPLPPGYDPVADRRLADALVREGAEAARVAPESVRAALAAAIDAATRSGLTIEELHELFFSGATSRRG